MTPEQTKRRMAVMAKHGEPGIQIQAKVRHNRVMDWVNDDNPKWHSTCIYRAVHIERTTGKRVPLPWSTIKCGMVVRDAPSPNDKFLVVETDDEYAHCGLETGFKQSDLTGMEYLDGTEWKPLWTKEAGEEKIVEIVSEEA